MRWKMQREVAGCGGIFHRASVTPTTCLASAAPSATLRQAMVAAATALQRKPYHKARAANPHGPLSLCMPSGLRPKKAPKMCCFATTLGCERDEASSQLMVGLVE